MKTKKTAKPVSTLRLRQSFEANADLLIRRARPTWTKRFRDALGIHSIPEKDLWYWFWGPLAGTVVMVVGRFLFCG